VAGATAANAEAFKGFYAGGLLGATQNNVEFKMPKNDNGTYSVEYKNNYSKRGLLFGLMAGWGQTFSSNMYLGGEVSLSYGTANQKKTHSVEVVEQTTNNKVAAGIRSAYKRGPVFGLAMRTGYVFSPNTLAYAKFGLEISRESFSWTDKFVETASGKVQLGKGFNSADDASFTETVKKTAVRPVLGFGLEYAMTKTISVRGEYAYTFKGPAIKSVDNGVVESQARSTSHSLLAGVAYHF
jgi:opacity protein-like surface antigen